MGGGASQQSNPSQCHLFFSLTPTDGNLGQPVTVEEVPFRSPFRPIHPVSKLPVVLEQQVADRQLYFMRGKEASRASMVAVPKRREVCRRRDELTSLQEVSTPDQCIGLV